MICWVTEYLGIAKWNESRKLKGAYLLDARDFVDKGGNPPQAIKSEIDKALKHIQQGEKALVCCEYGISRSNALAAGILAKQEGIELDASIRRVIAATKQASIGLEILSAVREALALDSYKQPISKKAKCRLLVTGASGFIGSSFLNYWKPGHEAVTPSHQQLDLLRGAVILDLLVKEKGINTLLHLANPEVYTTNESMGAALVMLKNVLDVCIANNLWLIYLSGWEIYSGHKLQELRADENTRPCPGGTYGQTKFLCEALANHYHQQYKMRYTLLRSAPVYGPGSNRPKFIWNFLDKAQHHKPIVAHRYRNGLPRLDLLHVSDLCKAIAAVIEQGEQNVFNIGTGVAVSTTEVAQKIIERTDSRSKIHYLEINQDSCSVAMDYNRAAAKLGWRPAMDLSQGLETILKADPIKLKG